MLYKSGIGYFEHLANVTGSQSLAVQLRTSRGISISDEYLLFYRAGVDGLFSDNSDSAVLARRLFLGN